VEPDAFLSWIEEALSTFDAPANVGPDTPGVLVVPLIDFRVHLQSYAQTYHRILALEFAGTAN
jgi:hypothetical protein